MTNEQLKEALLAGETVLYEGEKWRLTAIIYRKSAKGNVMISAELLPLNGSNSLTAARVRAVERICSHEHGNAQ